MAIHSRYGRVQTGGVFGVTAERAVARAVVGGLCSTREVNQSWIEVL